MSDEHRGAAPKKKLLRLSPGDAGDLGRLVRPLDDCFSIEYDYMFRESEERRRARAQAGDVRFHSGRADAPSEAWTQMLDLVEEAAADGRTVFWPAKDLAPEIWMQITELPPTISKLTEVTHLRLYGSHLVRIPPQIGLMRRLVDLDVYTSYRLHWFPFEIAHCRKLRSSRVSTRALYGSYSLRAPFPDLDDEDPSTWNDWVCSVCGTMFEGRTAILAWVSYVIATDVLPLLVRACSQDCLDRLPRPPDGYVSRPHRGGVGLVQPPTETERILRDRRT